MSHAGTILAVQIHRVEITAPDVDLSPAAALLAAAEGERKGGLAPLPTPRSVARLRAVGPTAERCVLVAGDLRDPDGAVTIDFDHGSVNTHIGQIVVAVAPERRRRGIGRALVEEAAGIVADRGRTLLLTTSDSPVPAGDQFAAALGFERGLVLRVNRLEIDRLDRALVDAWIAAADPEYELVPVVGAVPDELLPAYIEAVDAMNDAPADGLDVEDEQTTPERVRAREARHAAAGARTLVLVARHRANGAGAGFTDVRWLPHTPAVLWQGGTATRAAHRGHGLGRTLKAAMLRWVLSELPEVKEVRTENAHSNPFMLAINDALGFLPFGEETIHQRRLA